MSLYADLRQAVDATDTRYEALAAGQGWRPSRAACCPMVVAGRRCPRDGSLCICTRRHHLLDHGRMWLDSGGGHVLTSEPYDADGEDLALFFDELRALGLRAHVSGASPWNPGATFKITVVAEADS